VDLIKTEDVNSTEENLQHLNYIADQFPCGKIAMIGTKYYVHDGVRFVSLYEFLKDHKFEEIEKGLLHAKMRNALAMWV